MVRRQRAADRAQRLKMRSPGTPPLPREVERLFWIEIAKGLLPAAAAAAVGASQPVGQRWFHNAGGMPSITSATPRLIGTLVAASPSQALAALSSSSRSSTA